VHGLEKEYDGEVKSEILDATTDENKQIIRNDFGFKTHGLVIYNGEGVLLQKLDGHMLKEPEIRGALEAALAEPSGGAEGS
jgi:hypothetical protein